MLKTVRVEQVGLRLEPADLRERERELPFAIRPAHRKVTPRRASERDFLELRLDDLAADGGGATEIRAQARGPARVGPHSRTWVRELEGEAVADELNAALAGGRGHVWPFHSVRW